MQKNKPAFFDIGANNGSTTIDLARQNEWLNFYAFEPTPEMYKKIEEQTKDLDNYILIKKAASNFNGKAKFNVSGTELSPGVGWGCSSLLDFSEKSKIDSSEYGWHFSGVAEDGSYIEWDRQDFIKTDEIEVEVITLKKFIEENNITEIEYLHLDAQGSDLNILKGMEEKISLVKAGQMEAARKKDILYNDQNTLEESIKFLEENGFKILLIQNGDPQENEANIYFSKKDPKEKVKIENKVSEENLENKFAYSRVYDIQSTLQYKKTEHYSNLIKWLVKLTNCQKYLELGVEYSLTIQEIKNEVKKCVGVDINNISNKENIDFCKMTTDDFFNINKDTFDIIFIDANHEYEQVKKDFDNSVKVLNKFGIIVLHDTDPIVPQLLAPYHCHDSYKIIDHISSNNELNIITFPIQETGMTFVMRKNDRRIKEFLK